MNFGGAVHPYSPIGELDTVVDVPVPCVASVAFGGTNFETLFITTGHIQESPIATRFRMLPSGHQLLAGSVFACRPGVTGLLVHGFAG